VLPLKHFTQKPTKTKNTELRVQKCPSKKQKSPTKKPKNPTQKVQFVKAEIRERQIKTHEKY